MPEISATDAARNFADLLDSVEHEGLDFTIVRRGKAVARIEPAAASGGADAKALLSRHRRDPSWRRDLAGIRDLLVTEQRQ